MIKNKLMFLRTKMSKMETQINSVEGSVDSSVATKVADLVNSAPATLDTLKELADALGNDPNFATTVASKLADIVKYLSVSAVTNVYTLDLSMAKNFAIETTNTTAKSMSFSNIPVTDDTILSISVKLKYTSAATMTYPTSTAWQNGTAPALVAGKTYLLLFTSYDKGTTWLGSSVGAW